MASIEEIKLKKPELLNYLICESCGKKFLATKSQIRLYFSKYINGLLFHPSCSVSCAAKIRNKLIGSSFSRPEVRKKIQETNMKRYGVKHNWASKDPKLNGRQTRQEKYGNPFYRDINKTKQTNLKKYGVECILQLKENHDKGMIASHTKESLEKAKNTKLNNIDKNGLNSYQRQAIKTKITKKIRYNNETYTNLNKNKETCKIKYGVDHYSKTKEFSKKVSNTRKINKEKNFESKHKNFEDINEEFFRNNFIKNDIFDLDACKSYFNVGTNWVNVKKQEFNIDVRNNQHQELTQLQIYNFIKQIYTNLILFNTFKIIPPLELDIYIPEKKLAIEFNGIYWHSSIYKEKNYHQQKSKLCQEKGIRLIHIYEDEWNDEHKKEIIKDIIKHALNIPTSENKIYARKCIIKEIENKEYNDFCNEYHIQGTKGAQVKLGLFYNNELVQIASFGKSRYDKRYEWEWIRGCPASNNNVIGGTSKLFKYFVRKYNPKSVLCYADFNKFDGKGYKECGFKFDKITAPDKFYFDIENNIRINRSPKHYKEYMNNVKNNKFLLLYGAGNLKFIWNK